MHSLSKNISRSIASISECEALQAARWIELGICTYTDPNTKGPSGPQHGTPRVLLRRQSLEMAQLQIEGKKGYIWPDSAPDIIHMWSHDWCDGRG